MTRPRDLDQKDSVANRGRLKIDRLAVIEFFDGKPSNSRGHATALTAIAGEELGVGLLKHYFEHHKKANVRVCCPCTQNTSKGYRLDCWLYVTGHRSTRLYQVEVKNWSAHAIGGKVLDVRATSEQRSAYMKNCWRRHWNIDQRKFGNPRIAKVLTRMHPPKEWQELRVTPLLCMWEAMHPAGTIDAPFFSIRIAGKHDFAVLSVFSMSAYLRTLKCSHLIMDMPRTVERLEWLKLLFSNLR